MLWKSNIVQMNNIQVGRYSVTSAVTMQSTDTQFQLTTVYGPSRCPEKEAFLRHLQDIRPASGTKWLILGDFNLIYRARDKNNRNLNLRLMRRFRTTLEFCELKEIRLQNRKFTWCNERRHPTLVKLTDFFATRSGASVLKIMFSTLYPQPTRITAHCFLVPKWGHVSQPLSDLKTYGSAFRAFTRSSQWRGTPRLSIQSLIIA